MARTRKHAPEKGSFPESPVSRDETPDETPVSEALPEQDSPEQEASSQDNSDQNDLGQEALADVRPGESVEPSEPVEPGIGAGVAAAPVQEAVIETVGAADGEGPALSTGEEALKNSGEMEEEPAILVDDALATLLKTPLGLRAAIEALLFVSPDPLTVRRIGNVLDLRDSRLVLATLKQLQADYDAERRGLQVLETAEGFRLATREMFGDLILRLKGRRRRPALSPSAMETLAIIAYRQPIIRAEIEAIRGVESSGAIRNLIDLGLVEMVGRKDVLGRPPMYGATEQFLHAFGLKDIHELPSIAELKRQYLENEKAADQAEQETLAARREEEKQALLENSEKFRAARQAAADQEEASSNERLAAPPIEQERTPDAFSNEDAPEILDDGDDGDADDDADDDDDNNGDDGDDDASDGDEDVNGAENAGSIHPGVPGGVGNEPHRDDDAPI